MSLTRPAVQETSCDCIQGNAPLRRRYSKRRNSDNDDPSSVIPLKNFFGIEIKDFACEIARLSLLIAEYQCDVNIMGQERARDHPSTEGNWPDRLWQCAAAGLLRCARSEAAVCD